MKMTDFKRYDKIVDASANQIFNSTNQMFNSTNQMFNSTNQIFNSTSQGYPSTNQMFNSTNQIFNSTSQGYPPFMNTLNMLRAGTEMMRSDLYTFSTTLSANEPNKPLLKSQFENFKRDVNDVDMLLKVYTETRASPSGSGQVPYNPGVPTKVPLVMLEQQMPPPVLIKSVDGFVSKSDKVDMTEFNPYFEESYLQKVIDDISVPNVSQDILHSRRNTLVSIIGKVYKIFCLDESLGVPYFFFQMTVSNMYSIICMIDTIRGVTPIGKINMSMYPNFPLHSVPESVKNAMSILDRFKNSSGAIKSPQTREEFQMFGVAHQTLMNYNLQYGEGPLNSMITMIKTPDGVRNVRLMMGNVDNNIRDDLRELYLTFARLFMSGPGQTSASGPRGLSSRASGPRGLSSRTSGPRGLSSRTSGPLAFSSPVNLRRLRGGAGTTLLDLIMSRSMKMRRRGGYSRRGASRRQKKRNGTTRRR
jgi:hypothetical protein